MTSADKQEMRRLARAHNWYTRLRHWLPMSYAMKRRFADWIKDEENRRALGATTLICGPRRIPLTHKLLSRIMDWFMARWLKLFFALNYQLARLMFRVSSNDWRRVCPDFIRAVMDAERIHGTEESTVGARVDLLKMRVRASLRKIERRRRSSDSASPPNG